MTSSFKARISSKEKLFTLVALFSLAAWIFPAAGKAHAKEVSQEKGLVFEIKSDTVDSQNQNNSSSQNSNQIAGIFTGPKISLANEVALAKVDRKVTLVRAYLESQDAPLANYTEILLAQPEWKKIIAISNSESNMGKHCYRNNCSGIMMGRGGIKPYPSLAEWIVDMNNLLETRYSSMSLAQMNGIYVVPRSNNWIAASQRVYNELTKIEQQVNEEYAQYAFVPSA